MITEATYNRSQLEIKDSPDIPEEFCKRCHKHRLLCWVNYRKGVCPGNKKCLLGNYYEQCYVRGIPHESSDINYNACLIYPLSNIPNEGWIPMEHARWGR